LRATDEINVAGFLRAKAVPFLTKALPISGRSGVGFIGTRIVREGFSGGYTKSSGVEIRKTFQPRFFAGST
jgi:hypothetical protein